VTFGGNNFSDFPDNQLTKLRAGSVYRPSTEEVKTWTYYVSILHAAPTRVVTFRKSISDTWRRKNLPSIRRADVLHWLCDQAHTAALDEWITRIMIRCYALSKYTVSQKNTHPTHIDNFAKNWQIFKILLLKEEKGKINLPRTNTPSNKKYKETILKLARSRLPEKQKAIYARRKHC